MSEAETVAADADRVKKVEEQWQSDLRQLLDQPAFRRYAWRWMEKLKMWSDAIPLNSELYVLAAEKRVALRMWREMDDVNHAGLLQMMQDAKKEVM